MWRLCRFVDSHQVKALQSHWPGNEPKQNKMCEKADEVNSAQAARNAVNDNHGSTLVSVFIYFVDGRGAFVERSRGWSAHSEYQPHQFICFVLNRDEHHSERSVPTTKVSKNTAATVHSDSTVSQNI